MSSATGEAHKSTTSEHACHHFSLAEIQFATNDFDDEFVIGRGGFGKVYKGPIYLEETSNDVAFKRLDSMSEQGEAEFRTEIEMLSKLRHCHLVSLIGFCDDNNEMILAYEYMPNGTLHDHLHKANTPLDWVQRLKIAIGAGHGLDYLHTGVGTQHGVIHRDVKSSNILLDERWAAKVSDFGLSKVGPTNQLVTYVDASVKGTFGYLDPEYLYTRRLTRKTDVFAFGVVLFELLSGRLPLDERLVEEECSLVRWAKKCVKDQKLDQMVDPSIRGKILPKCLRGFAEIANRCLYSVSKERPSMSEVVASLQVLLELQENLDHSAQSSGLMGFNWKVHKHLVSTTKQNSDESGITSQESPENHMDQRSDVSNHGEMPPQHGELVARDLKNFTYDELEHAMRNFSYVDVRSYSIIYKGWVDKTTYSPSKDNAGLPITIKRLCRNEHLDLKMLKEFSHPNLLKLLGYCKEKEQPFLVYEFMPNGNFQDCLNNGVAAQIPLVTRVKIVLGIARGIVFLHRMQKTWEDKDFTVKLSDYDIKLVHGRYSLKLDAFIDNDPYNYPGCMVFTEVLTGREISNFDEFQQIEAVLCQRGAMPLRETARLCYKICNMVDSESEMLKIFKEYAKYLL